MVEVDPNKLLLCGQIGRSEVVLVSVPEAYAVVRARNVGEQTSGEPTLRSLGIGFPNKHLVHPKQSLSLELPKDLHNFLDLLS